METYKTKCPECLGITNHQILAHFSQQDKDYPEDTLSYNIIQCLGCETISMLYQEADKENIVELEYNYPDDHLYNIKYHECFLKSDEVLKLPKIIQNPYNEVKIALKNEIPLLTGLGLRTILEAICIDQKIVGRNLEKKLLNLNQQGYISNISLPIVDKLREIGNISAHKIKSLDIDSLIKALQITNHILSAIYILPKFEKQIKTNAKK